MPPPAGGGYGGGYDPEDPEVKGFDFTDESIRKGFIRKVYSILCVSVHSAEFVYIHTPHLQLLTIEPSPQAQLCVTLGVIALFTFHQPTQVWVRRHPELSWIALGVLLVTMITLACCDSVRRKTPMNFICLALFTLAQSFVMGVSASRYNAVEVLMAVGITAAVCLGLTLFAFQTKWDFTVMGGVLFVAVIILMVFGIVAIFVPGKTIAMVYASLGAFIFCIYLVYDTQMMMGGKHKYSISPEEYIFAALNLYLDIVQIFMYILMILGLTRSD